VSLLAGVTPGMHYPVSPYYLRRVRMPASSPLVSALRGAAYTVEESVDDPTHTVVVEFPVCVSTSTGQRERPVDQCVRESVDSCGRESRSESELGRSESELGRSETIRSAREVSMWEQLGLAAFLQRYWADNQVSCTVSFDPLTEGPQLKYVCVCVLFVCLLGVCVCWVCVLAYG
jgi:ribonucleoside-triphosphate reductase (thioredoxin)